MYTYSWFTLLYSINQHNIVIILQFKKKVKKQIYARDKEVFNKCFLNQWHKEVPVFLDAGIYSVEPL